MKTYETPNALLILCDAEDVLTFSKEEAGFGETIIFGNL